MDNYIASQIGKHDLQQQSIFFTRLPVEIRLEIYEHLSTAPQHVEKSWGIVNRRAYLKRRLQQQENDKSSSTLPQQTSSMSSLSCLAPGLSLLLVCRRAYLEATNSIQPRSLVFTDLDALSAYLTWPSTTHARRRVRELECSWHAEGPGAGGIVPAWKAERWGACCDALAALPRVRRIRACIFSSSGRYHAQEKTVAGLRRLTDDGSVRVDVNVITESADMNDYQFMTGRNLAMFLLFG